MIQLALDKALATGEIDGIPWVTLPSTMWGINGYAKIPDNHPWQDLDENEINALVQEQNLDTNLVGGAQYLTYGDWDGWIGFDTGHAYDYWQDNPHCRLPRDYQVQWTADLVAEQAQEWARIIHATQKEAGK